MCYEPRGLWVVELIPKDNVKTIFLDEDTKITNVCLNHDDAFRSRDLAPSSIKLRSNGYVGTICTLTPAKTEQALVDILLPKGAEISIELISEGAVFVAGYHVWSTCVGADVYKVSRPGGAVSNPKAGKVSPPSSVPSKRTASEGSSDPGPSRRPTMDSRRADSTRAQTKTPVPFTFSPATPMLQPPLRLTFNPEITSSTPQPTAKLVPQTPSMFGSVPQFRFRTQRPSEDMPGGFTPPLDRAQASSTNVSHITRPQTVDDPLPWTVIATNAAGHQYEVEIVDRQIGSDAEVTKTSVVTFQFAIRDPRTGITIKTGSCTLTHVAKTQGMFPGICLGLGGMKVGGSRRVSLPASSRTGWGSIDTIPDDVGHIVELMVSEVK